MEPSPTKIAVSAVGPISMVRPSGELNSANADQLATAIDATKPEPGRFVYVDLTETTFIDAAVLRVLAQAGNELADRGSRLGIFGASGIVAELLTTSQIGITYGARTELPDVLKE